MISKKEMNSHFFGGIKIKRPEIQAFLFFLRNEKILSRLLTCMDQINTRSTINTNEKYFFVFDSVKYPRSPDFESNLRKFLCFESS
jgi:hypothetical protein